MVSSGGSAAHCVLTGIRPGAVPNGSFVVMAIAAATPAHLARSITSVINTVPTPESWARGSMVIDPHARDCGPPVEEVRAHDAAVLLGGDQVEAVVGEQIGEKPCRGFAQGKSGGKLVPLQRPGTPRSKSALLARHRLPGLAGA
jgi:hypothetical protein